MGAVWTLYEESNIKDKEKKDFDEITRDFRTFSSFDAASKAMRDTIKRYALTQSELFDGKGNMIGLENLIYWSLEDYTSSSIDEEYRLLRSFPEILRAFFMFEPPAPSVQKDSVPEMLRAFFVCEQPALSGQKNMVYRIDGSSIELYDSEEDPWILRITAPYYVESGGMNPRVLINTFQMDEQGEHYFCRLHSGCEEYDYPAYVDLELVKTEME